LAGHLRRRALVLEYQGTNYAGFQFQENADTIQNQLEQAGQALFKQSLRIKAASRTDSGVHARGQVAAFDLAGPFPEEKLVPALNHYLPRDIRVRKSYPVPDNFNPQKWAKGKIYRYFIFNRPQSSAFFQDYTWHVPKPLDLTKMNQGAKLMRGTHDFACFQAAGSPITDTVRTLWHLNCQGKGDQVIITCAGDGFLYNMVRIIAGTLVEVGLGKRKPEQVQEIIKQKTRKLAGKTSPASGLFLERVLYRPSLDTYRHL
jgi:tRNA pseudouridine38-40 synthase